MKKITLELDPSDAQGLYDHTGTMPSAPGSWSNNVRAALSEALAARRPPNDFWLGINCGHPADPVAWVAGDVPTCHCGKALDPDDAISDGKEVGAPGPLVPCQGCGCLVSIPSDA